MLVAVKVLLEECCLYQTEAVGSVRVRTSLTLIGMFLRISTIHYRRSFSKCLLQDLLVFHLGFQPIQYMRDKEMSFSTIFFG